MKQPPAPNRRARQTAAPLSFSLLVLAAAAAIGVQTVRSWAVASQSVGSESRAAATHLRLMTQLGGTATKLALRGGMAYLGEGPRVVAVDVSDPQAPARRGASAPLPGVVRGMAWSGNLLAVIYRDALANIGNDGLALLDVTDADHPGIVAQLPLDQGPQSLAAVGSRLFVTGHDAARGQTLAAHEVLLAIDAADPARPQPAGKLVLREPGIISPAPVPLSILEAGDTLWLLRTLQAGNTDETEVIAFDRNLAPADDSQVNIRLPGRHASAAADAARTLVHLIMVEASRGRVTLQTLEPRADVPLRSSLELIERRGCGGPLSLRGTLAAYADRCSRSLQIIDLGDPDQPRLLGRLPLDIASGDLAWSGDKIVLAGGAMGGLRIVDAADPARPSAVGRMAALGSVGRLALHLEPGGNAHLYASDPEAGLWTLDPRAAAAEPAPVDPSAYLISGPLDLPQAADLVVADGRLVVGGWSEGLRPFDLATPGQPRPLPTLSQGRRAESLTTDGRRIYSGLGSVGLAALSFGPEGLEETARLEQPLIWQIDLSADGQRLVGQALGAFFALDPVTLQPLRSWAAPAPDAFKVNRADSLALDGDTLHLGVAAYTYNPQVNSYSDRLMSLRLDPAPNTMAVAAGQAPGTIGSWAGRLLAEDGLILVAGDGQLSVLRSTADGPLPLAEWASPGSGSDLLRWTRDCADEAACVPDLLFLADGDAGLAVLALEADTATPTASADRTATPTASRPTEAAGRRLWLPRVERKP